MKRAIVALVAAWHLEMAVNAGIAASVRPPKPSPKPAAAQPQCKPGTPCHQLQQQPQKLTAPVR